MALSRRTFIQGMGAGAFALASGAAFSAPETERPNFVLAMTDDQGWGETEYNGHPLLKTPNLNAMAENGLRLDRFYAAGPVCSPTRASFMTGRTPYRCSVPTHGRPLPVQERTIGQLAKLNGYGTGFFGKWHLNGIGGHGKVLAADDPLSPGTFGFDHWLACSNFYDLNQTLGSPDGPVENEGESSIVLAEHATRFIKDCVPKDEPFFAVVWYPSPHGRYDTLPRFQDQYPEEAGNHLGEITAVDESIGMLRKLVRDLGVADNTMLLLCSDNGAPNREPRVPHGNGPLAAGKGTLWEGGIRVPGIIEWPGRINPGRRSDFVSGTSDIYPTIEALMAKKDPAKPHPIDGVSLLPLFDEEVNKRSKPLGFKHRGGGLAWIDGRWKLHRVEKYAPRHYEENAIILNDLVEDVHEDKDISEQHPDRTERMTRQVLEWEGSVQNSAQGGDYK
jgi:arylsulfatase A-like enzyme